MTDLFHAKFPARKFVQLNDGSRVPQPGPWLDVIREANGVHDGFAGAPNHVGPWWAGGSVEEYEHFRVVHHPDQESVSLVATDDFGSEVLTEAYQRWQNKQ